MSSSTNLTVSQRQRGAAAQFSLTVALMCGAFIVGSMTARRPSLSTQAIARPVDRPAQATPDPAKSMSLRLDDIDLGVVERGGKRTAVAWLRNTSDKSVFIQDVKTSCDCVEARILGCEIGNRNQAPVVLAFDDSQQSGFAGKLRVGISIIDEEGRQREVGTVQVEVTADTRLQDLIAIDW